MKVTLAAAVLAAAFAFLLGMWFRGLRDRPAPPYDSFTRTVGPPWGVAPTGGVWVR